MEVDAVLAKAFEAMPNLTAGEWTQSQILDRMESARSTNEIAAPNTFRLCLEQIRQAVADLTSPSASARKYRQSAREWVSRANTTRWLNQPDVTSFDGCCEVLGVDAVGLRARLLAFTDRERERKRRRKPVIVPRREPAVILLPRLRGRPPRIVVARAA